MLSKQVEANTPGTSFPETSDHHPVRIFISIIVTITVIIIIIILIIVLIILP